MVPICKISFSPQNMNTGLPNVFKLVKLALSINNFDLSVFILSIYFQSLIDDGTRLPTKDETSETIVRNL